MSSGPWLCGLVNRPDLNGTSVTLLGKDDRGREMVMLPSKDVISVKPECVTTKPSVSTKDSENGTTKKSTPSTNDSIEKKSHTQKVVGRYSNVGHNIELSGEVNTRTTELMTTLVSKKHGKKDVWKSAMIIEHDNESFILYLTSEAKGALDQLRSAAAMFGISMGDEDAMSKVLDGLPEEKAAKIRRLMKVREHAKAATVTGETLNAQRILEKCDMKDAMLDLMKQNRAEMYVESKWSDYPVNCVGLVPLSESNLMTEFLWRTCSLMGQMMQVLPVTGKRHFDQLSHFGEKPEVSFIGSLPRCLDATFAAITVYSMASVFRYLPPRRFSWARNGFIEGLTKAVLQLEGVNNDTPALVESRQVGEWFNLVRGSKRTRCNRDNEDFKDGKRQGKAAYEKIRKTDKAIMS